MLHHLTNEPRDYAWGDLAAIAEFRGQEASGRPEAELWLGAHRSSPARFDPPLPVADNLAEYADHELGGRFPFLLKLLAADAPLSLQAHPDAATASAGFDRETAAGLEPGSARRNYVDRFPKPELLVALSDPFSALSGFRQPQESRAAVAELPDPSVAGVPSAEGARASLLEKLDAGDLRAVTEWILGGTSEVAELLTWLCRAAGMATANSRFQASYQTVADLALRYPGDPGVAISLLLNRVDLRPLEALFLDAGNIHAYLRGLGVELMAPSDNVLRGGLTTKRVDVPELLAVLDFSPIEPPFIRPETVAPGVLRYQPVTASLVLYRMQVSAGIAATVALTSPAIAICEDAHPALTITGTESAITTQKGQCVLATREESPLTVTGDGVLWLATVDGEAWA